jgi:hypothetical protein
MEPFYFTHFYLCGRAFLSNFMQILIEIYQYFKGRESPHVHIKGWTGK